MKRLLYLVLLLTLLIIFPACVDEKVNPTLSYTELEIEMNVGETINIKPTITGDLSSSYNLEYELSDPIAEIDNEGNLTALEEGYLDVYVTIDINPNTSAMISITIKGLSEDVYKITLDVNGGDKLETNIITFKKGEKVELPIPVKEGYMFLGWYEGEKEVTEIKNKNYDLVAKWESLESRIEISYALKEDEKLSNYVTRKELINDLIKDIKEVKGSTYTLEYFKEYEGTGYGIFASAAGAKTFYSNEKMLDKWGWIIEYTKQLREEAGLNANQFEELIEKGYASSGAAQINLEIIAFICEKKCIYTSGELVFETIDYSKPENKDGYWETMSEYLLNKNIFKKEDKALEVLPEALKIGLVFEGWYTSSNYEESTKITESTILESNITIYPKFKETTNSVEVTYNYNGGVSKELYNSKGTEILSFTINMYNGTIDAVSQYNFIFDKEHDPKDSNTTRIYVDEYDDSGVGKIVAIKKAGENCQWPVSADYVVYGDEATLLFEKVSKGDIAVFVDGGVPIPEIQVLGTFTVYKEGIDTDVINETYYEGSKIPTPGKEGYLFLGWYDDYANKYEDGEDLIGMSDLNLHAVWQFKGRIVGEFETESYVAKGNNIQLLTTQIGKAEGNLIWTSENPEIATVTSNGTVQGVSEGVATIVVSDSEYSDVNFVFYVTVLNEDPSGILKLLTDSNNSSVFTRNELIIGIISQPGYFYTDVVGGVSKLLFEDYVVYDDYYLSNPANKSNLVANGIEFITLHYAADMDGSAANGGKNLAVFNKSNNETGNQASWHYGTGNDGVWACQTEKYGAWHAGSSKTMTWHDTGIKYKEGDPEFAKITLESDNYFYLNGQKTLVENPTNGKALNNLGLAFKVENGNYYISGCYYNTTYRYISSTGGNNNSIGIESSCAEGSDLWLTWQYSAQLCASLLLKYNLPLTRLVGHHFFSGKWCPQPMLENDNEIWWEFIDMVRQEMSYFQNYSDYELSFSSESEYLKENGRVTSLPSYTECITYDVSYTINGETKTITLSSILPGTIN